MRPRCPAVIKSGSNETTKATATAVAFVISKNLRRNLTETQKALLAARIANLPPHRPGKGSAPIGALSQEQAADQFNIARRSVQRAADVLKYAVPQLVKACEADEFAVSKAAFVATIKTDDGLAARPAKDQLAWLRDPRHTEAKWRAAEVIPHTNTMNPFERLNLFTESIWRGLLFTEPHEPQRRRNISASAARALGLTTFFEKYFGPNPLISLSRAVACSRSKFYIQKERNE